ncbi:MAG: hypothetical protein HUU18_10925 [Phycisphaerales bacterium]|nr:hypothetical protein [Phycisphaerales bacterium]
MDTPPIENAQGIDGSLEGKVYTWPVVIGVISIVLSSLGLVCGGCGAGMLAVLPSILKDQGELPPTMSLSGPMLVHMGLGLLNAIVLLVGGILLIRRNPTARMLHLVYAITGLPLVAFGVWVQFNQMAAMDQWVAENPNSPFAQGHSSAGGMIGMAVGVVLGGGWPVFLLIWFGVIKNKADSMGVRPAPPPV